MSVVVSSGGSGSVRHTPEAARVRQAMLGLFLLGALTASMGVLIQLWSGQLMLDLGSAGDCFLVLGAGAFLGVKSAPWLLARSEVRLRVVLTLLGVLAGVSIAAVTAAYSASGLLLPLFGLGLALGVLGATAAGLLYAVVTPTRGAEVLALGGFCFLGGGTLLSLTAWLAARSLAGSAAQMMIAAVPVLAAGLFWAGAPRRPLGRDDRREARRPLPRTPAVLLLFGAVLLHSSNLWLTAGWLPTYLVRGLGASVSLSLFALFAFWCALTCAGVAALRLPRLQQRPGLVAWPLLCCLVGCSFLVKTVTGSGAVAGALLLGAGLGSMFPLAQGIIAGRAFLRDAGSFRLMFCSLTLAGAAAPALAGRCAAQLGVDCVIWLAAALSLATSALLFFAIVEGGLSEAPVH